MRFRRLLPTSSSRHVRRYRNFPPRGSARAAAAASHQHSQALRMLYCPDLAPQRVPRPHPHSPRPRRKSVRRLLAPRSLPRAHAWARSTWIKALARDTCSCSIHAATRANGRSDGVLWATARLQLIPIGTICRRTARPNSASICCLPRSSPSRSIRTPFSCYRPIRCRRCMPAVSRKWKNGWIAFRAPSPLAFVSINSASLRTSRGLGSLAPPPRVQARPAPPHSHKAGNSNPLCISRAWPSAAPHPPMSWWPIQPITCAPTAISAARSGSPSTPA